MEQGAVDTAQILVFDERGKLHDKGAVQFIDADDFQYKEVISCLESIISLQFAYYGMFLYQGFASFCDSQITILIAVC